MYMPESELLDQVVTDTERQAFKLLPALVDAMASTRSTIAVQLADLMGNPGEFLQYISGPSEDQARNEARLLRVFRENVELLVHKTWVEKTEEKPKERLLADLEAFERDFMKGSVSLAFLRFVAIARSVATLLFGSAGRASDFILYAFRIDPKFGLFFWYVGELENQTRTPMDGPAAEALMRMESLIGVFTLSCF